MDDKHNTIRARFKGKNGSLGYQTGRVYELEIDTSPQTLLKVGRLAILYVKGKITICEKGRRGGLCPYSSKESFLVNWEPLPL